MKINRWILWIPIIGFIYSFRLIRKNIWFDEMFKNAHQYVYWTYYQISLAILIGMYIISLFL